MPENSDVPSVAGRRRLLSNRAKKEDDLFEEMALLDRKREVHSRDL
jgi:hypothetical protein